MWVSKLRYQNDRELALTATKAIAATSSKLHSVNTRNHQLKNDRRVNETFVARPWGVHTEVPWTKYHAFRTCTLGIVPQYGCTCAYRDFILQRIF